MHTISVNQFIRGIRLIYDEKPLFEIGCDGSYGKCDNLGLIRGGLLRGGAVKVRLKNLNQLRRSLTDVRPINAKELKVGNVVLRGENGNYNAIGVVVSAFPLEIMYMTRVTVKKDSFIDSWDDMGWLSYVTPEDGKNAVVDSGNGTVKLFGAPNFASALMDIPDGTEVKLYDVKDMWARVNCNCMTGFVLSKYIKQSKPNIGDVDIEEIERAYLALGKLLERIRETQNEDKCDKVRKRRKFHLRRKAKVSSRSQWF